MKSTGKISICPECNNKIYCASRPRRIYQEIKWHWWPLKPVGKRYHSPKIRTLVAKSQFPSLEFGWLPLVSFNGSSQINRGNRRGLLTVMVWGHQAITVPAFNLWRWWKQSFTACAGHITWISSQCFTFSSLALHSFTLSNFILSSLISHCFWCFNTQRGCHRGGR